MATDLSPTAESARFGSSFAGTPRGCRIAAGGTIAHGSGRRDRLTGVVVTGVEWEESFAVVPLPTGREVPVFPPAKAFAPSDLIRDLDATYVALRSICSILRVVYTVLTAMKSVDSDVSDSHNSTPIMSASLATSPVDTRSTSIQINTAPKKTSIKQSPTAIVSLLSGAIAGGVEATATYPFEFAKTRAQLQASTTGSRNPFAVIATVAKSDGIGAIYTGCSTLIVGTAFKAGVRFLSFDSIRTRLADERGILSPARGLLAGMMAGAVESVVAVTPTERVKTALIDNAKSNTKLYNGGFHATKVILQTHGIAGLYRGLVSTTMKQSATSAVRMGSYNVLKEFARRKNLPQNSAVTFGLGAIAGTITVYATQPFDTIKTRAQSAKGATTGEAFRSVMQSSGVRGFWSGSTMRLGRLVFSGGIVFTVYEKVASLLTPSTQ